MIMTSPNYQSLLSTLFVALFVTSSALGQKTDPKNQDTTNAVFGKGLIHKVAADSTWYAKVAFRFQTQFQGVISDVENIEVDTYSDRFYVRRARIKGDGWATKSGRLKYKFEYDVHNGFVLDAVVKWVFDKNRNWELWFGQTKLPGNIERVISSQKLQFVDRSLLNSRFNIDRDAGIQLRHKHTLGKQFVVKEKFAFSQGEGLNQSGFSEGHGYTARLELFPFGKFKGSEYVSSDMKRNPTPKLMLAATYDYNNEAARTRGQKGDYVQYADRDLETIFIDAHLKYQGLSLMVEYVDKKTADGTAVTYATYDTEGNIVDVEESYYTGQAINIQLGKLISKSTNKSPWEIAGRYTQVDPEEITANAWMKQYGIAVSKYIVGHNLKVQSDINLLQEQDAPDELMFRLQTEFNF